MKRIANKTFVLSKQSQNAAKKHPKGYVRMSEVSYRRLISY